MSAFKVDILLKGRMIHSDEVTIELQNKLVVWQSWFPVHRNNGRKRIPLTSDIILLLYNRSIEDLVLDITLIPEILFFVVLGLELRAFTLSQSTNPIFVKGFLR
jgi:hypothetical protein